MNALTATALGARRRKLPSIAKLARKIGVLSALPDHAGISHWNKEVHIPPVWAWAAGIVFAAFVLFGSQILGWLLSFAL